MKNFWIGILAVCVFSVQATGQRSPEEINRMKQELRQTKYDSVRGGLTYELAYAYRFSDIDSSLYYTDLTIQLAEKENLPWIKGQMLSLKGATVLEAGKLPESMQFQFEALEISEKIGDTSNIAFVFNRIGNIYMELGDYKKANEYYFRSKDLFEKIGDIPMVHNELSNIGNVYDLMQIPDSGLYYQQIVYEGARNSTDRLKYTWSELMSRMGNAYKLKGNSERAMFFYRRGIQEGITDYDFRNLTMNYLLLATVFDEMNMPDSAITYAYNAFRTGKSISFRKGVYDASILMSGLFKKRNREDSALKYLTFANIEKDSLTGIKRFRELQHIILDQQERERNAEAQKTADKYKQRQTALLGGLAIFLVLALVLYRNNKQKQKSNRVLESTLTSLRATQKQLVQSEKMASLGELTAGIAHEIQNPLNFVNNFSEVSNELIDEMKAELDKGDFDEAKAIASDVKQNLEKISHHGKRADAIVKGMLQHSRTGSGKKEQTDINALCDEYLRLAYHGLRAKDQSFQANFETSFDAKIGTINVLPQELGRVILNLINNAFYAVSERKRKGEAGYEPRVTVTTQKSAQVAEIIVKDNGTGIPKHIVDKIFQPFFTTKPTGQGTGLGLSLSYDIVKAHRGELKVETTEGEGTSFQIILPVQ